MRKLTQEERFWAESHRKAKVPCYCQSYDGQEARCRAPARWMVATVGDEYVGSGVCKKHAADLIRCLNRSTDNTWRLLPAWVALAIMHVRRVNHRRTKA